MTATEFLGAASAELLQLPDYAGLNLDYYDIGDFNNRESDNAGKDQSPQSQPPQLDFSSMQQPAQSLAQESQEEPSYCIDPDEDVTAAEENFEFFDFINYDGSVGGWPENPQRVSLLCWGTAVSYLSSSV